MGLYRLCMADSFGGKDSVSALSLCAANKVSPLSRIDVHRKTIISISCRLLLSHICAAWSIVESMLQQITCVWQEDSDRWFDDLLVAMGLQASAEAGAATEADAATADSAQPE